MALLLSLHFLALSRHGSHRRLFLRFYVTLHPLLIDLTVKYALVRVLHFVLVHALLLDLLSGLSTSHLFAHFISLPDLLFLFLLLQSEIGHVLRVYVRLFIESGTLMGQIALLIRVPGVVLELWHRGQITSRLA